MPLEQVFKAEPDGGVYADTGDIEFFDEGLGGIDGGGIQEDL